MNFEDLLKFPYVSKIPVLKNPSDQIGKENFMDRLKGRTIGGAAKGGSKRQEGAQTRSRCILGGCAKTGRAFPALCPLRNGQGHGEESRSKL